MYKFWSTIWSFQCIMKYGEFLKSVINKIYLFFVSKLKYKLQLEFPFGKWNITSYVINKNFKIKKKIIFLEKKPHKSKNFHQQNDFLFEIYIWIWIFCANRMINSGDIAHLWFIDDVQKFENAVGVRKLWTKRKEKLIKKIRFWYQNHVIFWF